MTSSKPKTWTRLWAALGWMPLVTQHHTSQSHKALIASLQKHTGNARSFYSRTARPQNTQPEPITEVKWLPVAANRVSPSFTTYLRALVQQRKCSAENRKEMLSAAKTLLFPWSHHGPMGRAAGCNKRATVWVAQYSTQLGHTCKWQARCSQQSQKHALNFIHLTGEKQKLHCAFLQRPVTLLSRAAVTR